MKFLSVLITLGLIVFVVWQTIGLIKTIKEGKAEKKQNLDKGEDNK